MTPDAGAGVLLARTRRDALARPCYGLETARHFHANGWNVIASMRTPREDVLPRSDRLRVIGLDVTEPERIAAALAASGPIDVLVNHAGIGLMGAFEATPMTTVREAPDDLRARRESASMRGSRRSA